MKKILVLSLVCLMLLGSFTACSMGEVEVPSSQPSEEESNSESTSEDSEDVDTESQETQEYEALFESDYYTEDGYFKDLVAADYMEVGDYLGLEIPEDILTVTDEVIDLEVENLLANYTEIMPVEDEEYIIVDGDTVNIDYVGSIDGVEFEGGSTGGAGTDVTIGVTSYIPGFLEQLIGHKKGENFDIDVTFPDDYGSTDLAGKDAVFNITINSISQNIVPEFTDEFISGVSSGEYETTQDYIDAVKTSKYRTQRDTYLNAQILDLITYNEMPANLIAYLEDVIEDQIALTANTYGVTEADIVMQYGFTTVEELIASESANIEESAKSIMLVLYIAQENGITVETADVDAYFGSLDWSSYATQYGENYMKSIVLNDAVFEFVVNN